MVRKEYTWRKASRVSLPAQEAGERLDEIKEESGGELIPSAIVEAARPEDDVLHPHFEWDDEAAAEKYREGQAGELARDLYVIEFEEPDDPEDAAEYEVRFEESKPLPVYASVGRPGKGSCYKGVAEVLSDEDDRAWLYMSFTRQIEGMIRKLREFQDQDRNPPVIHLLEQAVAHLQTAEV